MLQLTPEEKHKLEAKISHLEMMTSAEFKVILSKRAWLGTKHKASHLFKKYGLANTKYRNAVLLLVIEDSQELIIYGDQGIHERTSTDHWPLVRDTILEAFTEQEYYLGLSSGIEMIAQNLIQHFPADSSNDNEISNEIIYA